MGDTMRNVTRLSVFILPLWLVSCSLIVNPNDNDVNGIAVKSSVVFEGDDTQAAIDSVSKIIITISYKADNRTYIIGDSFDFHEHGGKVSSVIPVNTTFTIKIEGVDNNGTVIYQGEQIIQGASSDTTVIIVANLVTPLPPENLNAQAVGDNVLLGWKDNSSNETGFLLKRSENSDNGFITIDTLPKDIELTIDSINIQPFTVYFYRIMAYNSAGVSDSCSVKFDPLEFAPIPTKPSGDTQITAGYEYFFSTDSSTCGNGHPLHYQFDWGDGSNSGWLQTPIASHAWSTAGTYVIRAKTRCSIHQDVTSTWSEGLTIIVEESTL